MESSSLPHRLILIAIHGYEELSHDAPVRHHPVASISHPALCQSPARAATLGPRREYLSTAPRKGLSLDDQEGQRQEDAGEGLQRAPTRRQARDAGSEQA